MRRECSSTGQHKRHGAPTFESVQSRQLGDDADSKKVRLYGLVALSDPLGLTRTASDSARQPQLRAKYTPTQRVADQGLTKLVIADVRPSRAGSEITQNATVARCGESATLRLRSRVGRLISWA